MQCGHPCRSSGGAMAESHRGRTRDALVALCCACLLLVTVARHLEDVQHAGSSSTTSSGSSSSSSSSGRLADVLRPQMLLQRRTLLSSRGPAGPGLAGLPNDAFGGAAAGSASSRLSFMAMDQQQDGSLAAPESLPACPPDGKLIAAARAGSAGQRAPLAWTADGSALVWGSPSSGSGSGSTGRLGSVFFLDALDACNWTHSAELPVPLLPARYAFASDAPPAVAEVAISHDSDVVLLATAAAAEFIGPPEASTTTEAGGGSPLPFVISLFGYRKVMAENATRPGYVAAAILPIPLPPSRGSGIGGAWTVSGLALSADGSTALVCLLQAGCGAANPSACPGMAHVFQLLGSSPVDGDDWALAATLPFQGAGSDIGHGASCALSPDGSVAAVLAGGVVRETVQAPIVHSSMGLGSLSESTASISSTGGSGGGSSGGSRRRLLADGEPGQQQQQQQYALVAIERRSAHLQMYSSHAANAAPPSNSSPSTPPQLRAWSVVGSHLLDDAVADCIAGAVPCRPQVDVTTRFAAVAFMRGPELVAEVLFHTAAGAAAAGRLTEFARVCTLEKQLVVVQQSPSGAKATVTPAPSADQIAAVSLRQPPKSLGTLRLFVATRNPAAVTVWTLSRRGDNACPPAKSLLEDVLGYAPISALSTDVTADGRVTAVSGLEQGNSNTWLAAAS